MLDTSIALLAFRIPTPEQMTMLVTTLTALLGAFSVLYRQVMAVMDSIKEQDKQLAQVKTLVDGHTTALINKNVADLKEARYAIEVAKVASNEMTMSRLADLIAENSRRIEELKATIPPPVPPPSPPPPPPSPSGPC